MTSRRDEEELMAIKEALERVKESQQRIRENYQSLEEIGGVLVKLLGNESPGVTSIDTTDIYIEEQRQALQ